MSVPNFKLNNGIEMPAIGLGCFSGLTKEERETGQTWFLTGIRSGYRYFDTAYNYGTEVFLGNAIKESGIPRKELFITTKLPRTHMGRVQECIDESLKNLGTDYVDLYLLHWPFAVKFSETGQMIADDSVTLNATWAEIEKVLANGKARAIGVSNLSVKTYVQLRHRQTVKPYREI